MSCVACIIEATVILYCSVTALIMFQIIHGQSINMKSHDVIFETRSIWLKLNSGRTILLSFRGKPLGNAQKPLGCASRFLSIASRNCPWTQAVSFSPRSISTKYSSAKPRSILLKNLSTMLKNLSAAPRGFEHCLEVFESIYFSHQKSHRAISYKNICWKLQNHLEVFKEIYYLQGVILKLLCKILQMALIP